MRKSLLKTPPSGLSSRLAPPAALVAVDAARRPASRRNGSAPYTGVPRVRVAVEEASALNNRKEVFFPGAHSAADRKRRPATPFDDDAAFHVVPLGVSGVGDEAFGLLLLDGRASVTSELHWFISVFVQKLDQILRQQAL